MGPAQPMTVVLGQTCLVSRQGVTPVNLWVQTPDTAPTPTETISCGYDTLHLLYSGLASDLWLHRDIMDVYNMLTDITLSSLSLIYCLSSYLGLFITLVIIKYELVCLVSC